MTSDSLCVGSDESVESSQSGDQRIRTRVRVRFRGLCSPSTGASHAWTSLFEWGRSVECLIFCFVFLAQKWDKFCMHWTKLPLNFSPTS